jgi:threonine dehydrogenase-like Zn-dependent dehydrogenase
MEAVGIRKGKTEPEPLEVPKPEPDDGEALVRTLRVGIDGTDHEVINGSHGGFPADDDYLILGHEAVGIVENPNGTEFEAGDIVVPTVRRPPASGTNEYFERDEADMAPPDQTVERGIDGAHGFMSEYFISHERYLIEIPPEIAKYGFLVEPISISEKALELAYSSREPFHWEPETGLVLGNGSLGLLTVAMLTEEMDVYCLGRRDQPDPSIDLIEQLGATYIDSRETPVEEIPSAYEPADLIYEGTGYAKHAITSLYALAPNGVAALLGIPESWNFEIDGGRFHKEFVMTNKAVVGSVNSGPRHFDAATETLQDLPETFLDDLVTRIADYREFEVAFEDGKEVIKTAVEFDSHEKRR